MRLPGQRAPVSGWWPKETEGACTQQHNFLVAEGLRETLVSMDRYMLDADAVRAAHDFAALAWIIGFLNRAGEGNIHTGLRRVYSVYVRLQRDRREVEPLIPEREPDGIAWASRADRAARRAISVMPQRDALSRVLRRFDGVDDGRSPLVIVPRSGHRARFSTGESGASARPETIDLTDSSEAVDGAGAPAAVGAAPNEEDDIPMLEYSASDLQRIDDSVEESQQVENNA